MARFHYSMQSILNIKLKMETQAKQEFGSARAALDEEEERLHNLQGRKTEYEKEAKRLLSGTLNVRAIEDNKAAILCMDEYISAQQQNVREAERKLEEARKRLADVMMERKTHETLKEKAFQQFLADEKKQEGKEVDELTSYTYGQRKKDDRSSVMI
ncbi:MAG: flagellar export protein FliJ [Lachnospiraceae bacterium]|nr:flagellar export protein FliJ [Lachnospiraceae bacterium]